MENPILYSQYYKPQIPFIKNILDEFAPVLINTTKSDIVLDIGCGIGDITKNLLATYLKSYQYIVGIDISEKAIQFAHQHNCHDNIVYEVLDIEGEITHFKETWNSFSWIISFNCLQWINDWNKAIANISELLSKDGECLFTFVKESNTFKSWSIKAGFIRWNKYMKDANSMFKCMNALECRREMNENGMILLSYKEVDAEICFDDIENVKGFLRSIDPFISRIPEEEKELYMEDGVNVLRSFPNFERNINGQTKYVLVSKRAIVRARKDDKAKKDFLD